MAVTTKTKERESKLIPWTGKLVELPWWALIILLLGAVIVYFIFTRPIYQDAVGFLIEGVRLTIVVSVISFVLALILGLILGLGRVSSNVVFYTLSSVYVELVRGIPILVLLIYFAFVVTPFSVQFLNWLGTLLANLGIGPLMGLADRLANLNIQDVEMTVRAIAGLAFAYGAFEAEVFRAGIQSIQRGQMEAARSLGMSYFQGMRYIILPQAIRRVLPPLGNDFIAMLKDSSLISVLAVRELTHLGKLNRSRTFRTYETWNTVTFLYLILTLSLSVVVKFIERRMAYEE
ncbi:MAG: ABC transporter permease subunit [Anaerolineae bacterium]|nr:ABC transporter permease subunit [Anaerolineae bacterium]NIN98545.1 ABC transporter permease subunit [Anaerolineae bacterium]NIQ81441.1 ABC transporter permease subunit [Anaerolineae bacterium]